MKAEAGELRAYYREGAQLCYKVVKLTVEAREAAGGNLEELALKVQDFIRTSEIQLGSTSRVDINVETKNDTLQTKKITVESQGKSQKAKGKNKTELKGEAFNRAKNSAAELARAVLFQETFVEKGNTDALALEFDHKMRPEAEDLNEAITNLHDAINSLVNSDPPKNELQAVKNSTDALNASWNVFRGSFKNFEELESEENTVAFEALYYDSTARALLSAYNQDSTQATADLEPATNMLQQQTPFIKRFYEDFRPTLTLFNSVADLLKEHGVDVNAFRESIKAITEDASLAHLHPEALANHEGRDIVGNTPEQCIKNVGAAIDRMKSFIQELLDTENPNMEDFNREISFLSDSISYLDDPFQGEGLNEDVAQKLEEAQYYLLTAKALYSAHNGKPDDDAAQQLKDAFSKLEALSNAQIDEGDFTEAFDLFGRVGGVLASQDVDVKDCMEKLAALSTLHSPSLRKWVVDKLQNTAEAVARPVVNFFSTIRENFSSPNSERTPEEEASLLKKHEVHSPTPLGEEVAETVSNRSVFGDQPKGPPISSNFTEGGDRPVSNNSEGDSPGYATDFEKGKKRKRGSQGKARNKGKVKETQAKGDVVLNQFDKDMQAYLDKLKAEVKMLVGEDQAKTVLGSLTEKNPTLQNDVFRERLNLAISSDEKKAHFKQNYNKENLGIHNSEMQALRKRFYEEAKHGHPAADLMSQCNIILNQLSLLHERIE